MQEDPLNLVLLKEQDEEAWARAWPILQPIAYKAAWQVLRDEVDAEDVASETVTSVMQHITEIKSNDHLKNYLFQAARHRAISLIQWMSAQKRDFNVTESIDNYASDTLGLLRLPVSELPQPGSLSDDKELLHDLEVLLKCLGNPCRFLIVEHFYGNKRSVDLASQLNLSAATVRMRVLRCLDKLRLMCESDPVFMEHVNSHFDS